MDFKYIDTHGHLNDIAFEADRELIIKKLQENNIATTIVGTDIEMNKKAIELSNRAEGRYAIIGQHPYDKNFELFDEAQYKEWGSSENVVAIGECGLDYFWPASEGWKQGESMEKERQKVLFKKHISLAREVDKPLVIHGRPTKGTMDAYIDIVGILKNQSEKPGNKIRGVAHFFAGDMDTMKEFLDLGFYFSFTGVVTFVRDYDEIVKAIPNDRIMAETDAPYVSPLPFRGKRNEPKYVQYVYEKLAEIKGIDPEEMRIILNNNASKFFSI